MDTRILDYFVELYNGKYVVHLLTVQSIALNCNADFRHKSSIKAVEFWN